MRTFLILLLAVAGLSPTAAQKLEVAAASSLTEAMTEVARAFETGRPGVTVSVRYGASGAMLNEIAAGTPTDVFASADTDTLARGIQRRLLRADRQRDFATNTLVLVVPGDRQSPVRRLPDLARAEVRRISMGRPATVPAGRYAKQAIDALRLWPPLQDKVVWAESVREVLDAVANGQVDAGFVYATDVTVAPRPVRVIENLEVLSPIRYPATVVSGSAQADLAFDFVLFLTQPAARAIFEARGFGGP